MNVLKQLFIEEGEKYVNEMSTDSRGKLNSIAYLTGLDRREVSKQLKGQSDDVSALIRSREQSILEHWATNEFFCNEDGTPEMLKRSGKGLSFETLVLKVGKNISHGLVLTTLISAGCIEERGNMLKLVKVKYQPYKYLNRKLLEESAKALSEWGSVIEVRIEENDLYP
jgi:hypothetical protein